MRSRMLSCGVAAVATLVVTGGGSSAPSTPLPAALAYTVEPVRTANSLPDAPFLIDRAGHVRKLFGAPRDSFALAWSPDGSRLAVIRRSDASLVILRPGHPATRLPLAGNIDFHLVWTPDGRRIAYQRGRKLFVADADGRHEKLLARNALGGLEAVSQVSISPDGRWLVYGGRNGGRHGLFIVATDGTSAATRIPVQGFAPRVALESPAWSPDGHWIAFNTWNHDVYVVHPDGHGRRMLGTGFSAVWSPDGARIAFVGFPANGVARVDGTRRWTLPGCSCELRGPGFWPSLSWSADGSRIAYVSGKGLTISSVRPDGTGARRILRTSPSFPWQPLWRPG